MTDKQRSRLFKEGTRGPKAPGVPVQTPQQTVRDDDTAPDGKNGAPFPAIRHVGD